MTGLFPICRHAVALFAAIFIALACSVTVPAGAQSLGFGRASNGEPINVEADEGIEWQRDRQVYIARGNARAVQGEVTVEADVLTAHYRPGTGGSDEIYQIDADGNVRITSDQEVATSDNAIYDVITGKLVMTGEHVQLDTPEDTITARESLEYFEDRQLAIARGDAVVLRDDRRVRADVLTAHFGEAKQGNRSSQMERIEAAGNVEVRTATDIVRADRGDYRPPSGIATVEGNVKITRGDTQLNGDRGEVNFKSGQSRLLSAQQGGRVRGLFLPPAQDADGATKGNNAQ